MDAGTGGGLGWLMAVNLVVWSGLFLYLLRLHRQVRAIERRPPESRLPETRAGEEIAR